MPQLIGILLTKFTAPFADGLIGHHYPSLQQYFFHITEAKAEPKVQPHGVAHDFDRKPVIFIFRGSRWGVHAATLPYSVDAQQVDNAVDGTGVVPARF
jgi:hypothetical protein